jgi:hypothetical protein
MDEKKNVLQTIKDQEMDRKSFLKMFGLVILSAVGARTIIGLLTPSSIKNENTINPKGFGSGKYGA